VALSEYLNFNRDDTAHVNDSYGSLEEAYEAIEIITLYLNQTGLKVFPVLGNHDAYPHNQVPSMSFHLDLSGFFLD
jgi:hypothetical protein